MEEFGPELSPELLAKAPYDEAIPNNDKMRAKVISINKFGSLHLNITHAAWDEFGVKLGDSVTLYFKNDSLDTPFATTFGDVEEGEDLIMKDDYGRMEIALNQDSFAKKNGIKIGENFVIVKK